MLKVNNISKQFGKVTAVSDISFEVKKGEIFGLLGENGAGKTTTLRMMATMLQPTKGSIEVCGLDTVKEAPKVREHIGILFGGESGLYDRLTVVENIRYFGELNGIDKATINERISYLAKAFNMEDYLSRRVGKLSKGMKQKVAFARSIIHNPDLMLLDEPTSGLDISAIRNVHDFISDCKNQGKTIIFSSHTMSEVEKLCDRIAIIHKGTLVDVNTIDKFKEKYNDDSLEEIFLGLVGGKNEF